MPTAAALPCIDLAFHPPYDWEAMLAFLARRAIPGVEAVAAGTYRRSVRIGRARGWVAVERAPRGAALRATASAALAPALAPLTERLGHLFDLARRPREIAAALGSLAAAHPGLRVPGAIDGFEVAVRAILGQQVTVAAATTIAARFAQAFGTPIATPHAGVRLLFPSARRVARLAPAEVAARGIIAARARAIVALAQALDGGALQLDRAAPVEATVAALDALPGVGPWTAHYIAMRALGWGDAFPHPDVAVLKALGERSPAAAARRAEQWRPWRAYAVLHLWKSL